MFTSLRSKLEQQADQLRVLREAAVDSRVDSCGPDGLEERLRDAFEQCHQLEGRDTHQLSTTLLCQLKVVCQSTVCRSVQVGSHKASLYW